MLSSARFAIKLDSLILGHLNSVHALCIILVARFVLYLDNLSSLFFFFFFFCSGSK